MIQWVDDPQLVSADDLFSGEGSGATKRDQALDGVLAILREKDEPVQLQCLVEALDGVCSERTIKRAMQKARKLGLVKWYKRQYTITASGLDYITD